MTKKFLHDSDDQLPRGSTPARLEVEISVIANEEDDAGYEILSIENLETKEFVEYEALSARDQVDIDRHAGDIAADHAHEAWFEAQVARADAMHDAWKEGE